MCLDLNDIIEEIENNKVLKTTVIGFGELGQSVISLLNKTKGYSFDLYSSNDIDHDCCFEDNVMVVYVGNINNQNDADLLNKISNDNKNTFNISFLNGNFVDDNLYNILVKNEVANFDVFDLQQIIDIILYFFDVYKHPGIIGVDLIDCKHSFEGKKIINYYQVEGDNHLDSIDKLIEILTEKTNYYKACLLFEYNHNEYGLLEMEQMIKRIRNSNKNLDLLYITNDNKDFNKNIKINLFI